MTLRRIRQPVRFNVAGEEGGGEDFTPMVAENFGSGTLGNDYSPGEWGTGRAEYDNTRSVSGTQSMKLTLDTGQPPATCGGSHSFGGVQQLPEVVPVGNIIWFRAKFYFPSAMTWGYNFGTSDGSDATTCGKNADGSGYMKFMAMSPTDGTARIYLLPPLGRRNVAKPATNTILLLAEGGGASQSLSVNDGEFTLDEWQDIQISIKVTEQNDGYIRYWRNGIFIGEAVGSTVSSNSNSIKEWRLGNYWNGVPYTDGAANREIFYMDEVIITSDMIGYGAPTSVDAQGRARLDPDVLVSDL